MDRFGKFTVLVNSIVRNIYRIKCAETLKLGLKSTHVSCLYYLYAAESPLTAKELCSRCGEDKAAVSRAVDFLEKEGFVAHEDGAGKKYRNGLFLTQKGSEVAATVAGRIESILGVASEGIDDAEREVLYKSLELIAGNLQKICGEK